jgi:hypothetical protein
MYAVHGLLAVAADPLRALSSQRLDTPCDDAPDLFRAPACTTRLGFRLPASAASAGPLRSCVPAAERHHPTGLHDPHVRRRLLRRPARIPRLRALRVPPAPAPAPEGRWARARPRAAAAANCARGGQVRGGLRAVSQCDHADGPAPGLPPGVGGGEGLPRGMRCCSLCA